jgi:hypothetical protein
VPTSPPVASGHTLAPPRLTAPPPPQDRGGSSRDGTQQPRGSTPPLARTSSSLLPAFPSPGVDCSRLDVVQERTPCPHASPATGVAGRVCRLVGTSSLPGSGLFSRPAPSWAGMSKMAHMPVFRQPASSVLSPPIECKSFWHQAGSHEISISCRRSLPPSNANAPADDNVVDAGPNEPKSPQLLALCHRLTLDYYSQQRHLQWIRYLWSHPHLPLHHQMIPP